MLVMPLGPSTLKVNFDPTSQFLLVAGPCVIESLDLCLSIAGTVKEVAAKLGGPKVLPFMFKASFDKANRSSAKSHRGVEIDKGLDILSKVRDEVGLPVTTDIHEAPQAAQAARAVDVLQIPAFLCRQTDLLVAAGKTGKPVNIKKGQFMAPWEMANAVDKVLATGNQHILLTERGTFFGYNRLVNDFTGIPQMQALGDAGGRGGTPVLMDATHSTQLPGGLGHATAGQRQFVPLLARAAAAAGVNGLFVEVHPNPDKSPSDAATILNLKDLPQLLEQCLAIRAAVR